MTSSSEDTTFSSDVSSDDSSEYSRAEAAGNRPMKMARNEKSKKKSAKSPKSEVSTITISDSESEDSPDSDTVMKTRDLLVDFGATDKEDDLEKALGKLEDFLGTSKLEYEAIGSLTDDLLKEVENLTVGLGELGDIFGPESVKDE